MSPSAVNDPLELLTNKEDRQPRFLSTLYSPVAAAATGFGMAMTLNWAFRRPIFSGIQKHIAFAGIGLFLGSYLDQKQREELATRDAVLRHYVELHPDDFPVVPRTKYADILEKWVPIR